MLHTSNKWIDERPFEEVIMDATPTQKYIRVMEMIEADSKVFAPSSSSMYDLELTILMQKLVPLQKKYKELVKKQDEMLQSGTAKQLVIEASILEGRECKNEIMGLESQVNRLKQYQEITRKEYVSLYRVGSLYRETGSKEVLAKGVEWVCSYADTLRKGII